MRRGILRVSSWWGASPTPINNNGSNRNLFSRLSARVAISQKMGLGNTFWQTVQSMKLYRSEEIAVGVRFTDIMEQKPSAGMVLHYEHLRSNRQTR